MDIGKLAHMSLLELQTAYASRQLSPVDVVEAMLAQIDATNERINALYGVRAEAARAEAISSEQRYAENRQLSAFDGVPVTIKDSVHAVGMMWHHGSAIHGEGVIGTEDAPPAARLKRAGAIILGKGVMPDFGLSGSGVSSSHGIARNPWGLSWSPGGSSAGGGASLAAGIGMMSVGSDIAGSVRLPAAHCGLAALKPTQGVIPHSPASTVRSAGPMARQAADLAAWTKLLSGPDESDRYSVPYCEAAGSAKLRIGACTDFGFGPSVEPAVRACFNAAKAVLSDLAGTIVDVDKTAGFDAYVAIDDTLKLKGWLEYSAADPALRCQTPAELYEWFKEAEDWTPGKLSEVNDGIEKCAAYCVELLSGLDVLLTPVLPVVNFPAEDRGIDSNMPLRHTTFTAPFNQSGNPAVSLCGGFDARGLPIGIQLVGKRFEDARLLKLATELEAALDIYGPGKNDWPIVPVA